MEPVLRTNTVRVPKAGELIAADLRKQIVSGEVAEGEALPSETSLMEHYGVSRPTLREAFRILESEQLISVRRGARGGARVLVPDAAAASRYIGLLLQYRKSELADVYEARTVLETGAVATVATRRTAADLRRLDAALQEGESLIGDGVGYARHDVRFHRLLLDMSGNHTLEVLSDVLYHIIDAHLRQYASNQAAAPAYTSAKAAQRAHVKVVELIRAKDSTKAAEFWRRHLEAVTKYMTQGAVPELIEILP
ncbi:FadR family transcriptional regulator [Nocardia vinacea]|uniref:FadR family transcriptional regulator n=1 Tax=Nocardia vinacea TaxID=96468 RepID=A0ABZ1YV65_9NOCA|nr:FadR/GntR family transcriptional regulator [Nocardia vinacea]